jgi:hypothetical protein
MLSLLNFAELFLNLLYLFLFLDDQIIYLFLVIFIELRSIYIFEFDDLAKYQLKIVTSIEIFFVFLN